MELFNSTLSIDLWGPSQFSPSSSASQSESASPSASESPSPSRSISPSASESQSGSASASASGSASGSASPSPAPVLFEDIELYKTERNGHFIEWGVVIDLPEIVDDYNFEIEYSLAPICGFEKVLDDEGDVVVIDGAVGPLSWDHTTLKQYNFNNVYYYRIHAILKTDPSQSSYSDPVLVANEADGFHLVMQEAENILYDMFYGEPTYLIKKKVSGVRCTNCWSDNKQQRTLTHCDVCNGSGFIDGYYCAILVQMADDSEDRKSDSQRNFEDVYDSKRSRMSNYPMVKPKDLIVTVGDYKRYVVMHVETTKLPRHATTGALLSKQNYVVSQLITLQELNPDDNEYNIDITSLLPS